MRPRYQLLSVVLMFVAGCDEAVPPVAGGKSVDHWLAAAENDNPKIRIQAIEKLGNIGGKSSEAIDEIIQALDDKDPRVRKVAIFAVVRNRLTRRSIMETLEQMSQADESEEIRKIAAEAHQNLGK